MKIKYIDRKEFKTTEWSGGKTTELFIYPENGDFSKREFIFRLSNAEVCDDYSVFTKLEEVDRWLMVIEGCMKLKHNDLKNEYILNPYDSYNFQGEWKTESFGQCCDINLMIKDQKDGFLGVIDTKNGEVSITLKPQRVVMLYNYENTAFVKAQNKLYELNRDKLIVFMTELNEEIISISKQHSSCIIKAVVNIE